MEIKYSRGELFSQQDSRAFWSTSTATLVTSSIHHRLRFDSWYKSPFIKGDEYNFFSCIIIRKFEVDCKKSFMDKGKPKDGCQNQRNSIEGMVKQLRWMKRRRVKNAGEDDWKTRVSRKGDLRINIALGYRLADNTTVLVITRAQFTPTSHCRGIGFTPISMLINYPRSICYATSLTLETMHCFGIFNEIEVDLCVFFFFFSSNLTCKFVKLFGRDGENWALMLNLYRNHKHRLLMKPIRSIEWLLIDW